jgi:hypothetical protein
MGTNSHQSGGQRRPPPASGPTEYEEPPEVGLAGDLSNDVNPRAVLDHCHLGLVGYQRAGLISGVSVMLCDAAYAVSSARWRIGSRRVR